MKKPFFSILLATYNRAHLLPRALSSVFAQDFQDWELIVVDDGSVDQTSKLMEKWVAMDIRIKYLPLPHQGLARTRNAGIAVSQGSYVTFLDSDDEYLDRHLSLHSELLRQHPDLDMLYGKVSVEGDPFVPDAFRLGELIAISECTQPGTFFIKAEVLRRVGGFPLQDFGEDSALLQKICLDAYRLMLSPYVTYKYYNNEPDSMCNRLKEKIRLGQVQ